MGLRALALLLLLLLQPTSGAAALVVHLCNGQALPEVACCCDKSEATHGIAAAHGGCCGEVRLEQAHQVFAAADAEEHRERSEAHGALSIPPWPAAAILVLEEVPAQRPTKRVANRATAPPLFIQHCSLLI